MARSFFFCFLILSKQFKLSERVQVTVKNKTRKPFEKDFLKQSFRNFSPLLTFKLDLQFNYPLKYFDEKFVLTMMLVSKGIHTYGISIHPSIHPSTCVFITFFKEIRLHASLFVCLFFFLSLLITCFCCCTKI